MATTVRKLDYYVLHSPNRAGEAARLLKALRHAKVQLLAFSGFPDGKGSQLDFIPDKSAAFRKAARAIGLDAGKPRAVFLIQGKDRVGVLGEVLAPLARAKINITAVDAIVAGKKRFAAILWVKPKDVARTAKLLATG